MDGTSLRDVVNVVAYATLARQFQCNDQELTRRPSPSAGALHPIEVLIVCFGHTPRVLRYDAREHQLDLLHLRASGDIRFFSDQISRMIPEVRGTALVMLGDVGRIAARYDDPLSLLWRDAGALLQTLFLTATAFDLSFCPLGILGHEVTRAVGAEDKLSALGVALVGKPRQVTDTA